MNLQEHLDAMKSRFESTFAPESVAIMHRSTEEIRNSGLLECTLKVGQQAPAFDLPNAKNEIVASKELLAKGPLVVAFFRGVW
jgi:hypothetical protein